MQLTLRLQSYCGQPTDNKREKTFERFPVFIGRSPSCDYVLDDVSKYISSNHATVIEENNQLLIQDTSSNGVFLNGATDSLGRGKTTPLTHGDTVTIGDYSLTVSVGAATTADDPYGDFEPPPAAKSADDPFDPFRGEELDWTPVSSKQEKVDDVWDDEPAAPVASSTTEDSDWANWPDNRKNSNAPAEQPSTDPFDWLPESSSEPKSAPQPQRSAEAAPGRPEPPARSAPVQERPAAEPNLDALFRAAGLNPSDFNSIDPAVLHETLGMLLRSSVDGMMALLQSRAELKNAIRADITRLSRENNNPLKFSADPEEALMKLLSSHAQRGYLPPDVAVNQAVEDLKVHQLAMLEGMKAAVRALLKQFDPEQLVHKLEKSSPLAANIPITREAKLWQLFEEKFSSIHEEAVSDFNELFGREFRNAYLRRIRKMGRDIDF